MGQIQFSRAQIDKAFRKFDDLAGDLAGARYQNYQDLLTQFVRHCENDSVMRLVTEPFRHNPNVVLDDWVENNFSRHEMRWPVDENDRISLLYQLIVEAASESDGAIQFGLIYFGEDQLNSAVASFNDQIVSKFTREVGYGLDEIRANIGNSTSVQREAMLVFHHHGNVTNINNSQNSNIAVGGSTISNSVAGTGNQVDVAHSLESLRNLIGDVAQEHRQAVTNAIDFLISASIDGTVRRIQVAQAAETIADASPKMKARLTELAIGITGSLAATGMIEGIKFALGL